MSGVRPPGTRSSVLQDDDALARGGAGLDVGLGVTDLSQAAVDLGDRDLEAPFGDGLELAGEDVGRQVGGLARLAGQPHPAGDHERGEVGDRPLAGQGSGEADGAVATDGAEGVGEG